MFRLAHRIIGALLAAPALLFCFEQRDSLDRARQLRARGDLRGALEALAAIRADGDAARRCGAWNDSAAIHLQLGEYEHAAASARAAEEACRRAADKRAEAQAVNSQGLSHLYRASYPEALRLFERALALSRSAADREKTVYRLNNIGTVRFYQGNYLEAMRAYREAAAEVEAAAGESWNVGARQLTRVNEATLFQRLGRYDAALGIYRGLLEEPAALTPAERGQLLTNLGALYRRLGDPVKALETYRSAQLLFARDRHMDGEIGAWKNTAIAQALNLRDYPAALASINRALALAERSKSQREAAQARIYRGEIYFRAGRAAEAETDWATALSEAEALGAVEEQWKALYGLGRVKAASDREGAVAQYREAANRIESLRAHIGSDALKSDFFIDKRDVFDALIQHAGTGPQGAVARASAVLAIAERAHARLLQDYVRGKNALAPAELGALQGRLPSGRLLLSYWLGVPRSYVVWMTRSAAGIEPIDFGPADAARLRRHVDALGRGQASKDDGADLGRKLLPPLSPLSAGGIAGIVVIPDGVLSLLPFETLTAPGGGMLIERFEVSYLPAAGLLSPPSDAWASRRAPWATSLVALADPAQDASRDDLLPGDESWAQLPGALRECRAIAALLPGRTEVYSGRQAGRSVLIGRATLPILHLASHAEADEEDPARSRILLAGDRNRLDYLFLEDIQALNLKGTELVTLSACRTAAGRLKPGEGVQSFGRAFLAAGARSTLSTLWPVADAPAAEFMKQFYGEIAAGKTKAAALRAAKLRFIRSGSSLSDPAHWAAFVLTGDGDSPVGLPLHWYSLAIAVAVLSGGVVAVMRPRQRPGVTRNS